jgi:dipeptidyl aminopeptidase/acylaminoacyl peptidase
MNLRCARLVLIGITVVLAACTDAQGSPPASASVPPASVPPASGSAETAAPSPTASPTAEGESPVLLRVQAAGVRMRAEPSTSAEQVATLPAGATVARTASNAVDADDLAWYEVRFGDVTGWVSSGPDGDWLASVTNGRIGFACTRCGEDGSRAVATVEPDGSDRRILGSAFGVATWSPDGERVVVAQEEQRSFDHTLMIMDADGSDAMLLGQGWEPAWSPDGEWLAFSNQMAGTLVVIDPDGRRFDLTVNDHGAPGSLVWAPDNERLAFVAIDCPDCPIGEPIMGDPPSAIYLFTPPMGSVDLVVGGAYYSDLSWSPDGSSLTYLWTDLSTGSEVRQLDIADGTTTTLFANSPELSGWEPSPDHSRLVALSTEGIVVADAERRDPRVIVPTTDTMNPTPNAPRWSPDGQWILYDMSWTTGDAVDTWIVPADGSDEPRLVSEDAYNASWQPVLVPLTD